MMKEFNSLLIQLFGQDLLYYNPPKNRERVRDQKAPERNARHYVVEYIGS